MVDDDSIVNYIRINEQLGEIKGILNTIVNEHARRLTDLDSETKQLRVDLTAVKEEAGKAITTLSDKIQLKWDAAVAQGNIQLNDITSKIATMQSGIADNRQDIKDIVDKNHGTLGKVTVVISTCVAVLALVWQIIH